MGVPIKVGGPYKAEVTVRLLDLGANRKEIDKQTGFSESFIINEAKIQWDEKVTVEDITSASAKLNLNATIVAKQPEKYRLAYRYQIDNGPRYSEDKPPPWTAQFPKAARGSTHNATVEVFLHEKWPQKPVEQKRGTADFTIPSTLIEPEIDWDTGLAEMVAWGRRYLNEIRDWPTDYVLRA